MKLLISMEATSDMTPELIKKYDFKIIDMNYYIDGEEYSTSKDTVESSKLYERMKAKAKTSTAAVNEDQYYEFFKTFMNDERTKIHVAFSSGLSSTYQAAYVASSRIYKEFGIKIHVVDSLCACSGQGMLGMIIKENENNFDDVDDALRFIENIKKRINHQFTVSDLRYLANGGRLSKGKSLIANLLMIKPVLYMDGFGKLIATKNVVSRQASLVFIFNQYLELRDKSFSYCVISHAGCLKDAEFLRDKIKEATGLNPEITNLGPVIGSHSGPGTIAIYFVGPFRDTKYE